MLPFPWYLLPDLLGFMVIAPLAILFFLLYFAFGRKTINLLFGVLLLINALALLVLFLIDSIPAPSAPVASIKNPAQWTAFLYRLLLTLYCISLLFFIGFIRNYLRQPSFTLRGKLFIGGLFVFSLVIIWTKYFLSPVASPAYVTKDWRHLVPWQPEYGFPAMPVFCVWFSTYFYVLWLLWRSHKSQHRRRGDGVHRSLLVKAVALQAVMSALDPMTVVFLNYTGVSILTLSTVIFSVVISVVVIQDQWRRNEESRLLKAEKERLAAEMKLARQVQQSILPQSVPRLDGYELDAVCLPAREVGGDYYDFFFTGEDRLALMIGDAVGKGLRAAMFITETHGLAHAAVQKNAAPDGILQSINAAFISSRGESKDFVTLLCGVLDVRRRDFLYASAGHYPPLLIRSGVMGELETGDLPLGISAASPYELRRIRLEPGDILVMFTDGVTEAINAAHEMYGTDRFMQLLSRQSGRRASDIRQTIIADVRKFAGKEILSDDLTLVLLRCNG